MKARRIDHVVVATDDTDGAAATFRGHFTLPPAKPLPGGSPTVAIGDARIAFVRPAADSAVAAAFASGGEGMAVICLEVADLRDAETALRQAGVGCTVAEGGLDVDPAAAHGVRLRLVGPPGR
jgi:catechol 2,3-dioxygenase-like lactoylglutathione lyase family enzyme